MKKRGAINLNSPQPLAPRKLDRALDAWPLAEEAGVGIGIREPNALNAMSVVFSASLETARTFHLKLGKAIAAAEQTRGVRA